MSLVKYIFCEWALPYVCYLECRGDALVSRKCMKTFRYSTKMPVGDIIYSDRYEDEEFEYRHVNL